MNHRRAKRALIVAGVAVLATGPRAGADTPPLRFPIPAAVAETPGPGSVRVAITLRSDPAWRAAAQRENRTVLHGRLTAGEQAALRAAGPRPSIASRKEVERELALRRLQGPAALALRSQREVASAVEALGGGVLDRDGLTNSLVAVLPRRGLGELASSSDIASIEAVPEPRDAGLDLSTAVVGAPAFWASGHTGGGGVADGPTPVDLAILDDKIEEDHPAFAGVTFQRPSDAPRNTTCGQQVNGCEHGTEVASMAISRGAVGCSLCEATDGARKGVAPGLDTVLDAEPGSPSVSSAVWALGIDSFGLLGAFDPAEVMSDSHGTNTDRDDSAELQWADKFVSSFGVSYVNPAGNEGPGQNVNASCIAYDVLCVGAFSHEGTADRADDVVPAFSSRGPTPGGRKKPDIVAIGNSEFANQHYLRDRRLWAAGTGTSLAAPQAAGAAALIAGAGVSDPLVQKAILIDSARQGRATTGSAMGTQTSWQPDWGWGALDLEAALAELRNFHAAEVPGSDARFYRAALGAAGDRATLVWNRRAIGCVRPGCGVTAFTLTNLDLQQLDPATGSVQVQSASAIDNVEQVRSPVAGPAIYKVKALSTVDGLPAEPFALAARRQVTPLTTPRPTIALSTDRADARPDEPVTVRADVANPSPDLSAEATQLTLDLPPGVELTAGTPTRAIGTLAPRGRAGDFATATWTVRGRSDGLEHLAARVSATRYGEAFHATGTGSFSVDGSPPRPTLAAPAGRTSDPELAVAWDAVDEGAGVASYDVEVSQDGGPFSTWRGATGSRSAVYQASVGATYRFRVAATDRLGNRSDYVTSGSVEVAPPDPESRPVPPVTAGRRSPRLAVTSAAHRGIRLRVKGSLERTATARIEVKYTARVGRRRVRARGSGRSAGGRFGISVRLPSKAREARRQRIAVRYPGDPEFLPETRNLSVRVPASRAGAAINRGRHGGCGSCF